MNGILGYVNKWSQRRASLDPLCSLSNHMERNSVVKNLGFLVKHILGRVPALPPTSFLTSGKLLNLPT